MSDITRTKVLEILEHNWTSLHNPDYTDEELGDALDFCITSLETDEAYQLEYEQPEFCGDCISREATKEAIRKRFPSLHDRCEVNIVINSMPCVLPKEKWILKNVDKSVLKIECPICSFKRNVLKETLLKFNYCPNCGADLREDDIDENIS